MKYTKETVLEEVLKHPKAGEILSKHKVPCLGCAMAAYEMSTLTLDQIGKTYGIDIEEILNELNK